MPASMNPCPCGYFGAAGIKNECSLQARDREESRQHIQNFVISNADTYISKVKNYDEIEKLSNEIVQTGIKPKDATHLACAITAECDYFITTDGRVTKYKTDRIKVVNPIDFIKIWRD